MIETATKVGPLLNRTKWFAEKLSWLDSFRLVTYNQSACQRSRLGFVRRTSQTKVIDLTASEEAIFAQFGKKTQKEIRRARREGVTCHFDGDSSTFLRFLRQVAKDQSLWPKRTPIEAAAVESCISYAGLEDTVFVMHWTLIDRTLRRARIRWSCSRYALEDSSELRRAIGRANRLLYFEGMRHFKGQGLAIYDLGGYSADQTDRKKMAINEFKDSFGGRLQIQSNYMSYPLFVAVLGRELLANLRRDGTRRG
jgi:hypothetical protein